MTQNERTLELLRLRGPRGLTALEALKAGCGMRLAARIADLRAAGHIIDSETITTPNGARVARYVLHERGREIFDMTRATDTEKRYMTWDEMRERLRA